MLFEMTHWWDSVIFQMAEEQTMKTHLTKVGYRAKSSFLLAEMWKDGRLYSDYCNVCGTRPAAKKLHEGLQTLL